MDAGLAAILGASIGAIAGLLGGLLNGWRQAKIEREKMQHERATTITTELRSAVADVTRALAAGIHAMEWLTWSAEKKSDLLTEEKLAQKAEEYNLTMNKLFPEIVGSLVVVASIENEVYKKLSPLSEKLEKLDVAISKEFLSTDEPLPKRVDKLAEYHVQANDLAKALPKEVREILRDSADAAMKKGV